MAARLAGYNRLALNCRSGALAWLILCGGCSQVALGQPLSWESGQGYRAAKLRVPSSGTTGFTLLPAESTGVAFTNVLSDSRAMTNVNLANGSGVALGDFDGDG